MNNWKNVKEILAAVLELAASERQEFLNRSNLVPEVLAEVESLLSFEEEAEDMMNFSAVEFSSELFTHEENSMVGQVFGNFRMVRELGFGGMGTVYLGERIDGKFQQKVALKLLKREMNTAALRRRFQQEREILASLDHPNIARLLDAGTTDDSVPYIAMEYVEGLPIDIYCSKNRLDLRRRLDLFCEVCSVVDFAHRNLIVHRDLKPSNILVTSDGVPKLLDFGISKILTAELLNADSATVTKLGAMTPTYASPEQIQNKSVTTATDIYSLGVILYELLCGHRPFEAKESDLQEIFKAVVEIDPPLPSSLLRTDSKLLDNKFFAKTEIAEKDISELSTVTRVNDYDTGPGNSGNTLPTRLNLSAGSLRGDLDNIVLKALRKEPERRYSSAENLSEDVKRHIKGLPVTARPNTLSYRAEKFFERNKVSAIAGVFVLITIIGGLATTLWQARVAQVERAKAENRFNDVRSLANSFLFKLSPMIEKLPGSTAAREELVKLALQYLDSLSKEASSDLELQRELAAAYEKVGDVQGNPLNPNIGDTKGALDSYQKAMMIREKLSKMQPGNPTSENELAHNYKGFGEINSNVGDYSKGKEYLDKALQMRKVILARDPNNYDARAKLAEVISSHGDISFAEYKNEEAIGYYDRSRIIYEQLLKEKPSDYLTERLYANTFVDLGEAFGWNDDLKNGEINLDKALSILVKLGKEYPNDQKVQRSLVLAYLKTADNYSDYKKEEQGIALFTKGIEVAERLSNADPLSVQARRDLAIITRKLAEVLSRVGKNKESLEKMMIVLEIFKGLRDQDPNNNIAIYDVANAQFAAGGTYLALKDHEGGIKILEEAKKGFEKDLSINPDHTNAARTLAFTRINIGTHLSKIAENGDRREYLKKALDNKREGIESLYKLKNDGKLSEYDEKYVTEAENELKAIEIKLQK